MTAPEVKPSSGSPADPLRTDLERRTWDEFREAGMLWLANAMLHAFGWAIVHATDEQTGEVTIYPVRTRWRGFPTDRNELGYARVKAWLEQSGDALTVEAELTPSEAETEQSIRDGVLDLVKR